MLDFLTLRVGTLKTLLKALKLVLKERSNDLLLIFIFIQCSTANISFLRSILSYYLCCTKLFQLSQGTLLKISPYLVKRRKSHFHTLPCGVSVIFGRNGYIWIAPVASEEQNMTGGYSQNLEEVVFCRSCMLL